MLATLLQFALLAIVIVVGNSFIGTTLVALCTSLPELVASLAALRIGAFDLAVGNVFGSNAFNMILLVPLDMLCPGSLLASVHPVHVVSVLAAILATAIAIMGQLYTPESRYRLIEPDAWLVLAVVLGSLGLVYVSAIFGRHHVLADRLESQRAECRGQGSAVERSQWPSGVFHLDELFGLSPLLGIVGLGVDSITVQ